MCNENMLKRAHWNLVIKSWNIIEIYVLQNSTCYIVFQPWQKRHPTKGNPHSPKVLIITRFHCSQSLTLMISESAALRLANASQIPKLFHYAVSLNADWAGPTGKRTIWKFERSPLTMPWTVFTCLLSPLYSHSAKRRIEKIGGVIIEMLVSVPQTR